jgi:hypothetical protein
MTTAHPMPGAWYDLTVRIHEAQAVTSCALESLPCGEGINYDRVNHSSLLISTVQDLLHLMDADARMIETQLKL